MKTWENQLVDYLSVTDRFSRNDLTEKEWEKWFHSDQEFDAWMPELKKLEREMDALELDQLTAELNRRILSLGGGPVLMLDLKNRGYHIRLGMSMKPFIEFKKLAAQDPVLKFFWFTHGKKRHGQKRAR